MSSSWQGVVLEVAAAIAGAVFTPRSGHLSPAGAEPLFDQLDARALVINADLLQRPEWQSALPAVQARLGGRPVFVQVGLPAGSPFGSLPTIEDAVRGGRP